MRRTKRISLKYALAAVLCLAMTLSLCGCSKLDYKAAVKLYEAGGYEGARAAFEALGEYEDSAEYAARAGQILDYRWALQLYSDEKYGEAAELFKLLGDYEKSAGLLKKAEDKLLCEKIAGRWMTQEVDMTDLLRAYMQEEFTAMGYEGISFDNIERLGFKAYYIFEDNGLIKEQLDRESFNRACEAMARISKNMVISVTEQEIAAVAAEYGVSAEELYAALGVSGAEDYLSLNLGMSVDEFLSMYYNEESMELLVSAVEVTGAWYVKDGVLYIAAGDEIERGEYDDEKDIITLTDSEYIGEDSEEYFDEEVGLIYPIELERADTVKPAA